MRSHTITAGSSGDNPQASSDNPVTPTGTSEPDAWWETAGDLPRAPTAPATAKAAQEGTEFLAQVEQPKPGHGWRPGSAAATLSRAFRNRPVESANGCPALERLLRSIAGDYGTHALVLEALIEILVSKGVMTEDEFEDLLEAIDARDGQLDGTLGNPDYHVGNGI